MKTAISKFYSSIKMSISPPMNHSVNTPSPTQTSLTTTSTITRSPNATTTIGSSPSTTTTSISSPTATNFKRDSNSDVERVFRYIDENGDGKISPSELQTCVMTLEGRRLSTEEAEAVVESTDSDGDGYLGLEDFQKLMEAKDVPEEEKISELKEAFGMFAVPAAAPKETTSPNIEVAGGVITSKSLKKMLNRLGDKKTVEECRQMINAFDLNGDGVLCFNEFVAMMR